MRRRASRRWLSLIVVAALVPLSAAAQGPPAQTGASPVSARRDASPRTPWGDPDLQGQWTNAGESNVPFERPAEFGAKDTLSGDELHELLDARDENRAQNAHAAGGVTGAGPVHWYEYWGTKSPRTSMVIDPPDGRIPPMTVEGQRRARQQAAAADETSSTAGAGPAGPADLSLWVRCITRGVPGGMIPTIYNANYQIIQAPGYVVIAYEMVHEARVIPVDGRDHLRPSLRQWIGDPRGRWEGDTLVVETTNFSGQAPFRGSTPALRVVERFTRVDRDVIDYRVTVEDPATWTRPWTAAIPLRTLTEGGVYEYGCHEGNLGLRNILSAARAEEAAAARQNRR